MRIIAPQLLQGPDVPPYSALTRFVHWQCGQIMSMIVMPQRRTACYRPASVPIIVNTPITITTMQTIATGSDTDG